MSCFLSQDLVNRNKFGREELGSCIKGLLLRLEINFNECIMTLTMGYILK